MFKEVSLMNDNKLKQPTVIEDATEVMSEIVKPKIGSKTLEGKRKAQTTASESIKKEPI